MPVCLTYRINWLPVNFASPSECNIIKFDPVALSACLKNDFEQSKTSAFDLIGYTVVHLEASSMKVTKNCAPPFDETSLGSQTLLCTISSKYTFLAFERARISVRVIFPKVQDELDVDSELFLMLRPVTIIFEELQTVPSELTCPRRLCYVFKSAMHAVLWWQVFTSTVSST